MAREQVLDEQPVAQELDQELPLHEASGRAQPGLLVERLQQHAQPLAEVVGPEVGEARL